MSVKIQRASKDGRRLQSTCEAACPDAAALFEALERKNSNIVLIKDCALSLRKTILNLENSKVISSPVTVEDITAGEVSLPSSLKTFYSNLYTGQYLNDGVTEQIKRYMEASSAHAVFA